MTVKQRIEIEGTEGITISLPDWQPAEAHVTAALIYKEKNHGMPVAITYPAIVDRETTVTKRRLLIFKKEETVTEQVMVNAEVRGILRVELEGYNDPFTD